MERLGLKYMTAEILSSQLREESSEVWRAMASMTAAAGSCFVSSATCVGSHCSRASSLHTASSSSFSFSSSSPTLLLAAVSLKNWSTIAPLSRRLGHDGGFGSFCIAPSVYASGDGVARASRRGDDNTDDAGVIKDMELFLDDLSLEYDSVWDTKPAWCQPWTIVGTGLGVITASWLPFHNAFIAGGVTLIIGLWWYIFLYVYPLGYSEMIAERRRMMENGSEDTYGRKIE